MAELPDLSHLPPITEQRDRGVDELRGELDYFIEDAIRSHPRSQQKELGPSEIGIACARKLGYKLLDVEPVNDQLVPWKPTIGTAVHTWLERVLVRGNRKLDQTRFLLEHKVDVGEISGQPVTGKADVYDRVTATVIDWKIVGAEHLRNYQANGPGRQYRAQAHAYGRGWARRGFPVDRVAIMFLPRDRELRETHFWHEPYDEQVAVEALTRVDGIAKLTGALGTQALPMLPTTDDWCSFCPHYLPASTELETACPGHAEAATQAQPDAA